MVLVQSGWDLPRRLTLDFDYRFVSRLASPGIAAHSTAGARLAWMVNLELSAVGEFEPSHYEFPSDPGPNVALKQSFCGRIVWTSEPE